MYMFYDELVKRNQLQNFCLNCLELHRLRQSSVRSRGKFSVHTEGLASLYGASITTARPTARDPMEAWFTGPRQY